MPQTTLPQTTLPQTTLTHRDTTAFVAQLEQVEAALQTAAAHSVLEIPSLLARLQGLLERLRAAAPGVPPQERFALRARIQRFQSNLALFSLAMNRSERVFQGYSRFMGRPAHEYTAAGIVSSAHPPAMINLSV